ncbi:MAG: bifunctional UDP-N-acetylglucosamine diphosphorylase/glucosamine-1-phosphate N-acetyltransferase GlmU [Burkholderiales bacterium]
MTAPVDVVILAAGKGKRMCSSLPKVLHRLGGIPLVQHVIDTACALGARRLCVVYGHGGEAVRDALAASDLSFALQEPQLGTGHAVQQALPHVGRDGLVLVLYGDVPLTRLATLRRLIAGEEGTLRVLTVNLADPTGYGRIVRDEAGRIQRIVEEDDATPAQRAITEVNTGIMVIPAEKLPGWLAELSNCNAQGEYYLTDLVALAIHDGFPVVTVQAEAGWETVGVNSKAQLATLERAYQLQRADELLTRGVTLADPARIDVRGKLECGADVIIDVNCVFEGNVRLGDRVTIGANCILRDMVVGDETVIAPFSHLEEASIGVACQIGPYARIRPGTRLAAHVHLGNFVEVKNSSIGERTKANHLTYVGDSEIGRGVNLGAGTIVCNYDGANKHKTIIEDDVFIGSDTQLIAPVRVGQGATIGAGTTVTDDIPPGVLALSRVKQVAIDRWKRPQKKVKGEE